MKIGIKVGKDHRGDFIEYGIKNELNNTLGKITSQYYEIIDNEILKNIPNYILYDFEIKIHNEIKRRGEN